jgi:hypothetical protein
MKTHKDQILRKKQIEGLLWKFKRWGVEIKEERGKKTKNKSELAPN